VPPRETPPAGRRPLPPLARFIIVGGIGSTAYVALSEIAHLLGAPASLASFFIYAALIPPAYLTQRRWSFQSRANHRNAFPRYMVGQGIGLMLSLGIPYLFVQVLGWNSLFAFWCVVACVAVINYSVQRFWAFAD